MSNKIIEIVCKLKKHIMNQVNSQQYIGENFNRTYELIDRKHPLGSGGAASVFKCKRKSDSQEFAVKSLQKD